ncbi:hypothetical protein EON65_28180 [archaeon]|nr:MAG: hypothetical protein EON65_28180 [archaeon]
MIVISIQHTLPVSLLDTAKFLIFQSLYPHLSNYLAVNRIGWNDIVEVEFGNLEFWQLACLTATVFWGLFNIALKNMSDNVVCIGNYLKCVARLMTIIRSKETDHAGFVHTANRLMTILM